MQAVQGLLTEIGAALPLAFAVWRSGEEEVFISDKLRSMLSADSNTPDAYTFVKLMRRKFGSFLNVAVEKIVAGADGYSNVLSNKNVDLKLTLYKDIYLFTANDRSTQNAALEMEKILDALPVYVWQKDRNLQITYCNEAYAKAVESNKEQAVANNVKLISSSKRGVYIDQSLYSSKPKKFTEHVVINGERRLLSIEETPFMGNNRSTGVAVDITDKEEIETSYRNYKKQANMIFDNISVPIAVFDAHEILVFANLAVIKLFQIDGLDIYNNCKLSDILDYMVCNGSIITSADILKYKQKAKELFRDVAAPQCVNMYLKNSDVLSLTITPNDDGGLVFLFENITSKVSLERKVNSLTSVHNEMLEALSEGIIIFGIDNRVKVANAAAKALWEQDIVDKDLNKFLETLSHLLEPDDEAKLQGTKIIEMISNRTGFSETLKFTSGKTIRCDYVPLHEGLNLLKFTDMSDAVALDRVNAEVENITNQIGVLKSNLVSNISQEVRAPIQAVSGFAEILRKDYFGELNEKQKEYCNGIVNSTEQLSEVVETLIDLSKIDAGLLKIKKSEVNLLKFVQDTISLFTNELKSKNITLSTDFTDPNLTIFIDESSMKKAMFHLISRAIRSLSSEGFVKISASIGSSQEYIEITLKDNGTVLPDDELERVQKALLDDSDTCCSEYPIEFNLILASKLIKMNDGMLSLQSNEQTGNVIICKLPIYCL